MTAENTALTVQARAAVALGSSKAETELTELAAKSKSITAITNKDGRTECHAAAMVAKEARVTIEKAGKAAREDATAFSKAVIAEEKRLVDLIEPEEKRLIGLRDEWDAKIKAEKEAAEAAERSRIAAIRDRIELIKRGPMNAALLDSAGAKLVCDLSEEVEIDDSFAEFYGEAVEAKAEAVAKLREIVAAKQEAEATAERIKAEQEAEASRLAEEAKRLADQKAELDRQAAEQRAAEAKRQAEERAHLDAERAELDRQRKEIEAAQAEQARIAAEQAAEERRAAQAKALTEAMAALPKVESQSAEIPLVDQKQQVDDVEDHIEQPLEKVSQPEPVAIQSSVKPDERTGPKVTSLRVQIAGELDKMNVYELSNVLAYLQALPLRNKLAA